MQELCSGALSCPSGGALVNDNREASPHLMATNALQSSKLFYTHSRLYLHNYFCRLPF